MNTSRLYHNTLAALRQHLPDVRGSQHDSMALVMVGLAQGQSGHLGNIARHMPLPTRQDSKEQRVRRLLDNPRITAETHYQPIVRAVIAGLVRQPIHLVLDRVLLHDQHNLLMVGLATRRRVIPLAWRHLDHEGSSGLADHQAILTDALALLPDCERVSVHADSEFRSQALFDWLVTQGCTPFLGLRSSTGMAITPDAPLVPLHDHVQPGQGVVYFNQVSVTEDRVGPVNLYAWWSKDERGKPMLRVVQTARDANPQTYRVGKRRMAIEPTFREWQRGGFGLDTSGRLDGARLVRLLIPLLLVYLWFMCVGRRVSQAGHRALVEDSPPRQWYGELGLFRRGVAWFQRQRSLDLPPPPVVFYMSP